LNSVVHPSSKHVQYQGGHDALALFIGHSLFDYKCEKRRHAHDDEPHGRKCVAQAVGQHGNVRVQMAPGKSKARGDFDYFNITLDGFAADRLLGLAERAQPSNTSPRDNGRYPGDEYSRDAYPLHNRSAGTRNLDIGDLGDILNKGGSGGLGDILGGVLGGKGAGRIGRIRLRATNFTFQGARYDALDATLGEVRFDWTKALRG
jgi:hypothetical protein